MALDKCTDDKVTIYPGRNRWLLFRTSRDGATQAEVIQTAGAFLMRFLGPASPSGQRSLFEGLPSPVHDEGLAEFVIGAARPVIIVGVKNMSRNDAAKMELYGNLETLTAAAYQCPTLRGVGGDRIWGVVVDFDWRAPKARVEWPARRVNMLGIPTAPEGYDLDWLLVAAHHLSEEALSPDTSIFEEYKKGAEELAEQAARALKPGLNKVWATVGLVALVGVGIYAYRKGGK